VWIVWVFLTAFLISKYEGFAKKKDRGSHGRSEAGQAD
jgi:hypothetical protein